MKALKFQPHLAAMIRSGQKTATWCLFDEKGLKEGDVVGLYENGLEEPFEVAIIGDMQEKPLGLLTQTDWEGHERFASDEAMYETYRGYYGREVGPDTQVKILRFNVLKKVNSAGGVIFRRTAGGPEVLLIGDPDYDDWFLPKGHQEEGETIEQAALREIGEEIGLQEDDLRVMGFLGSFERPAVEAGELKTEHYFLIEKVGEIPERPEPGRNWVVRWFSEKDLPDFYIHGQEQMVRGSWRKMIR
jgi:8-oxo-dGTP pyrophosphatase MutT (NUDIX family)